jgi:signal peptidase II
VPSGAANPTPLPLRRRGRVAAAIVVAVIALDQLTKAWAVSALPGSPVSIWGQTIELRLARNTGSAFSLFQNVTPLLALLAVGVAVILIRAVHRAYEPVVLLALALVLGGALGNVADRLFRSPGFLRGAVVDFVRIDGWPTFNVADSAITVGAVVLVWWGLFGTRADATP